MKPTDPFAVRAGMHVTRSRSRGQPARAFPTHTTGKPFTPPKMAMSVNRDKRGPETSRPVNVGKSKPYDKAVRRDLFYPSGGIRRGRTPT